MRIGNRLILGQKVKESIQSVLPVTAIVFILCFSVISVPTDILMAFVVGAAMLIFGMGFFTLGTDLSMMPVGEHVGSAITRTRKLWFIIAVCLLVGAIITISEPDLQVLANQVPNIPNSVIVGVVAVGVGIFLVVAMLRILFAFRLSYLLIFFYFSMQSCLFLQHLFQESSYRWHLTQEGLQPVL